MLDLVIALPIWPLVVVLTEVSTSFNLRIYDSLVRIVVTSIILHAVYFAFWESSRTRATPGKILFDLRVATASDQPLTFNDAMVRFALRLATFATLGAGLWFGCRDTRGRALHDRLSGSTVVAHHVTPGQLRCFVRQSSRGDWVAALVASLLSLLVLWVAIPAVIAQVRVSDRFDAALSEVAPVLDAGDPLVTGQRWSPRLAEASRALGDLGIAIEVNDQASALTLRIASARASDEVGASLQLHSNGAAGADAAWICTDHGFAPFLAPSGCRALGNALILAPGTPMLAGD